MIDKSRNMQDKVEQLLKLFPAVAIIGARQAGKTTFAKMLGSDWRYMDLEKPSDFERISAGCLSKNLKCSFNPCQAMYLGKVV